MVLFAQPVTPLALLLALYMVLTLGQPVTSAAGDAEQKELVEKSRMTLDGFLADSNMGWFRDHMKEASGIFIVPQLLKAAFFFGGEGGSGVFLVKDDKTGEWSDPAFYTMRAGSFGFQFGAQASEFVLLVMSQRGVESLLTSTFKLGGDISVAVGPVGAVIATRDEWNRDYYGTEVRPTDILVRRAVTNPQTAGLKAALALAAKGKASAGQTSTFVPE